MAVENRVDHQPFDPFNAKSVSLAERTRVRLYLPGLNGNLWNDGEAPTREDRGGKAASSSAAAGGSAASAVTSPPRSAASDASRKAARKLAKVQAQASAAEADDGALGGAGGGDDGLEEVVVAEVEEEDADSAEEDVESSVDTTPLVGRSSGDYAALVERVNSHSQATSSTSRHGRPQSGLRPVSKMSTLRSSSEGPLSAKPRPPSEPRVPIWDRPSTREQPREHPAPAAPQRVLKAVPARTFNLGLGFDSAPTAAAPAPAPEAEAFFPDWLKANLVQQLREQHHQAHQQLVTQQQQQQHHQQQQQQQQAASHLLQQPQQLGRSGSQGWMPPASQSPPPQDQRPGDGHPGQAREAMFARLRNVPSGGMGGGTTSSGRLGSPPSRLQQRLQLAQKHSNDLDGSPCAPPPSPHGAPSGGGAQFYSSTPISASSSPQLPPPPQPRPVAGHSARSGSPKPSGPPASVFSTPSARRAAGIAGSGSSSARAASPMASSRGRTGMSTPRFEPGLSSGLAMVPAQSSKAAAALKALRMS